jgi:hypothetical protein
LGRDRIAIRLFLPRRQAQFLKFRNKMLAGMDGAPRNATAVFDRRPTVGREMTMGWTGCMPRLPAKTGLLCLQKPTKLCRSL